MACPIVVSFYTPQKIYRDFAEELKAACDGVGLEHFVLEAEDRGSWLANCAQKGPFCLEAMRLLKRPILWLDADSRPLRVPDFLVDTDVDFAVHAWNGPRRRQAPGRKDYVELPKEWPDPPRWMNSGTAYFGHTPKAIELLERWAELCLERPNDFDQWSLQQAWCDIRPETLWLPVQYCAIRGRGGNTVIWHDLASVVGKVKR